MRLPKWITFFPEEKILARIDRIKELKNELSVFRLEDRIPVVLLGTPSELALGVEPLSELQAYAFDAARYLRYISVGGKAAEGRSLLENDVLEPHIADDVGTLGKHLRERMFEDDGIHIFIAFNV